MGFGEHFCVGSMLARVELRLLYAELLNRKISVEFDGEPTLLSSIVVNGPEPKTRARRQALCRAVAETPGAPRTVGSGALGRTAETARSTGGTSPVPPRGNARVLSCAPGRGTGTRRV
ncbi:hypothetical protein [Kitasatospora viridis]|uniref:hypothetical protein n=1 Tax=Kitasatospora viridis TaxID=281105 RepID=UPI003CCC4FB2